MLVFCIKKNFTTGKEIAFSKQSNTTSSLTYFSLIKGIGFLFVKLTFKGKKNDFSKFVHLKDISFGICFFYPPSYSKKYSNFAGHGMGVSACCVLSEREKSIQFTEQDAQIYHLFRTQTTALK